MKRKIIKQNLQTNKSSFSELSFTDDQWLVIVHDTGERFFDYDKLRCLEYISKKDNCKNFTLSYRKLPVTL